VVILGISLEGNIRFSVGFADYYRTKVKDKFINKRPGLKLKHYQLHMIFRAMRNLPQ
jgi:hypothetical protein